MLKSKNTGISMMLNRKKAKKSQENKLFPIHLALLVPFCGQ